MLKEIPVKTQILNPGNLYIPAKIRRALGLDVGDSIIFKVDENKKLLAIEKEEK